MSTLPKRTFFLKLQQFFVYVKFGCKDGKSHDIINKKFVLLNKRAYTHTHTQGLVFYTDIITVFVTYRLFAEMEHLGERLQLFWLLSFCYIFLHSYLQLEPTDQTEEILKLLNNVSYFLLSYNSQISWQNDQDYSKRTFVYVWYLCLWCKYQPLNAVKSDSK